MVIKDYKDHLGRYTVSLSEGTLEVMFKWCKEANGMETGGILLGFYSADLKRAEISRAIGPTSDSSSGQTWFVRGIKGLNRLLHKLWILRKDYYLGEWHYHPNASPTPSNVDISQLEAIAKSKKHSCPEPVLVIVGGDPRGYWTMSVTVFPRDGEPTALTEQDV